MIEFKGRPVGLCIGNVNTTENDKLFNDGTQVRTNRG